MVVRYFQSIPLSKSSLNNQIFTFEIKLHPRTCFFIVNPSFKTPPLTLYDVRRLHRPSKTICMMQNTSLLYSKQHSTRPISFLSAKMSVLYDICSNKHSCSPVPAKLSVVTFTSILEKLLWTIICQRFAFRFRRMILHTFPVSKIVTKTTVIVMMMKMMIIIIIILSESS
jgi:hypothetical protein